MCKNTRVGFVVGSILLILNGWWPCPLGFASCEGSKFGAVSYVSQGVLPSIQRDVTFPGWVRCPFSFACRGASLATGK